MQIPRLSKNNLYFDSSSAFIIIFYFINLWKHLAKQLNRYRLQTIIRLECGMVNQISAFDHHKGVFDTGNGEEKACSWIFISDSWSN
ncbi:hypothetical protein BCR42DRAFT_236731 [Absidia repens]|uniref:Uncharacterized protein n=1 Tax=Absidia repens TaxID=90262 RepID=A0A1X2IMP6_9FUNG|nr:hypothetical protein BCR42DRAFT_236731 [Absidia repens]